MLRKVLETQNYYISENKSTDDVCVISISSLGFSRSKNYQQFYRSIERTGASAIFLTDMKGHWFNHEETDMVFNRLSGLTANYNNVVIVGDSMGGSGALLLSNYIPRASRILAFAPQYSVAKPFIEFDTRYRGHTKHFERIYFDHFAECQIISKSVLLYGNTVWMDFIHRSMFAALGYPTVTIDKAPHTVARFLQQRNRLQPIFDLLIDFDRSFTKNDVESLVSDRPTGDSIKKESLKQFFIAEGGYLTAPNRREPIEYKCNLISTRKPATQSSLSKWSEGKTVEDDASRAICHELENVFSFHTSAENRPWWEVDLEEEYEIEEVRIFNRQGDDYLEARASKLSIEKKVNDEEYVPVFSKLSVILLSEGNQPFCWRPSQNFIARWIRIRLFGENCFHLRRVEIYGKLRDSNSLPPADQNL